jgi:hypothetical protein
MWFLIFVSLFFGHFVAKLESQREIDSNDAFMKQTVVNERSRQLVGDTLAQLPVFCYQLYMNGTITPDQVADEAFLVQITGEQSLAEYVDQFDDAQSEMVTWNTTDLREFMTACGRIVFDAVSSLEVRLYQSLDVDNSVDDLTFNWIRCLNDSEVEDDFMFPSKDQVKASRPEAQADFYSQTWRERQVSLREKYLEEFGDSKAAALQAFANSVDDATTGDKCDVNSVSGAWFWFTVMTTVGKFEARSTFITRGDLTLYSTASLFLNE